MFFNSVKQCRCVVSSDLAPRLCGRADPSAAFACSFAAKDYGFPRFELGNSVFSSVSRGNRSICAVYHSDHAPIRHFEWVISRFSPLSRGNCKKGVNSQFKRGAKYVHRHFAQVMIRLWSVFPSRRCAFDRPRHIVRGMSSAGVTLVSLPEDYACDYHDRGI